jgi:hypothetical protein
MIISECMTGLSMFAFLCLGRCSMKGVEMICNCLLWGCLMMANVLFTSNDGSTVHVWYRIERGWKNVVIVIFNKGIWCIGSVVWYLYLMCPRGSNLCNLVFILLLCHVKTNTLSIQIPSDTFYQMQKCISSVTFKYVEYLVLLSLQILNTTLYGTM